MSPDSHNANRMFSNTTPHPALTMRSPGSIIVPFLAMCLFA